MSRGQISLEFVYVIGAALLITIFIIVAVSRQFDDLRVQKEAFILRDASASTKAEFFIAAEVKDGYHRSFTIPYNLSGSEYNVSLHNTTLVFSAGNLEFISIVPSAVGNLKKGSNIIRKEGGVIYLN